MSNTQDPTFQEWMLEQYTHNQLADLSNHGAQGGFSGMIYYTETTALYDKYCDDIWEMLEEDRESYGNSNCLELVASFNGANYVSNDEQLKNLLVWYAAERIAYEATQGEYVEDDDTPAVITQ